MAINSVYQGAGWSKTILDSLVDIRSSLNAESMKLSSGRVASSYADMGSKITSTLNLRSRINSIDTYADLINSANNNIAQVSQALTSFSKLVDNVMSGPLSLAGGSDKSARTSAKLNLTTQLSTLVSYLNNQDSMGYSFGSDASGMPPVASTDTLLDGQTGKAGLKQLFEERFAADAGADGLGRLTLATSGSTVSLTETAGIPFGLKLGAITSGLNNATISQPTGSPPTESVTLNGQPNSGDAITFAFNLPDGTSGSVTLQAASTAGTGQFVIGATPADTAQNLNTALTSAISNFVATDMRSASALYTSKNFYAATSDNPPERVSGSPASSATSVIAGTASNTVIWYQGKSDTNDPRSDRKIQLGDDISVEFGVRANEAGFQTVLASVSAALLVASNFSNTESTAAAQMSSIRARASQTTKDGQLGVQSIVASIASSQISAKTVDDQNKAVKGLLQTRLADLEDAKPEETAARISSLSTQLQASYQVAAKLLNMSLASFL